MEALAAMTAVVLDTNIFIAAAFNRNSHSARILEAVRQGQLRMVWNANTRQETEHIVQKIPQLSWDNFSDLFQEENCYQGQTTPEQFTFISDPEDRKFAALSEAAEAILITQDQDLLSIRKLICVPVLKPRELVEQILLKTG